MFTPSTAEYGLIAQMSRRAPMQALIAAQLKLLQRGGYCVALDKAPVMLFKRPRVTLETLTLEDLVTYPAARIGQKASDRSLSPRYALRLMRLIDRVLRHHAGQCDTPPNTAASDWIAANPVVRFSEAETKDPLPEPLCAGSAPADQPPLCSAPASRPQPRRTGIHHLAGGTARRGCCRKSSRHFDAHGQALAGGLPVQERRPGP